MSDKPRQVTVTTFRVTLAVAVTRIRQFAAESGNIAWSNHAVERMVERGIFDVDVLRVMRGGFGVGQPEPTPYGEWKVKMVRKIRGSREVGVVVIILKSNRLLVKTVEWEDL